MNQTPAPKHWWESKTIWANVAVAMASLVEVVRQDSFFTAHPEYLARAGVVVAIINIFLRFGSPGAVKVPGQGDAPTQE